MNEIIVLGKRGTWYWSPKRWFYEKFISEYGKAMGDLRKIDDAIGEWTDDLEFLAKQAELSFKANRLADLFIVLFEIRNRLEKVTSFIPEVNEIEREIEEGLESKITLQNVQKNAGITDFLGKFVPEDWKKEYLINKLKNKERQKRYERIKKFINTTKIVVKEVKNLTNKLEENRSHGDIGSYAENLRSISKHQVTFVQEFHKFLNSDPYFLKVLNYIEDKQQEEQLNNKIKEQEEAKQNQAPKQEINAPKQEPQLEQKAPEVPDLQPLQQPLQKNVTEPEELSKLELAVEPQIKQPETFDKPYVQNKQEISEDLLKDTIKNTPKEEPLQLPEFEDDVIELSKMPSPVPPELPPSPTKRSNELKKSHEMFLGKLMKESISSDKYKLANLMLDYSSKIEEYDLDSSLKLLAIAEGIIDG